MRLERRAESAGPKLSSRRVSGRCLCGAVELEIDFPAFWSWHDHSDASRRAHGAAYATYIGCWRKHARVTKGRRSIARFEDAKTESTRSFCSRCGMPLRLGIPDLKEFQLELTSAPSIIPMARYAMLSPTKMPVALSASFCWTRPNSLIVLPKALRSFA